MRQNDGQFRQVPGFSLRGRGGWLLWFALLLCAAVVLGFFAPVHGYAASPAGGASDLERQISQEQSRAKARRDSLTRLTDEERKLDKDLAAAEVRILRLEDTIAREEKRLETLAASDAELRRNAGEILTELAKTEEAMTEALRVLWELHARRLGVKGRDLPDWPVTDREHAWSLELFATLDTHRQTLAEQRKSLDAVGERRMSLHREVQTRLAALNTEKSTLLADRVRYGQDLDSLRKRKRDTEEELGSILALVGNLNLRLQTAEAEGDISRAKGKIPWPVAGTVRGRFNPAGNPPVRGVTLALHRETPVHAVHWGKVVHNDVVRGIGRVVILMHGNDYYSLYAFLAESPLRVGQDVGRGDVVGKSGFVTTINGPGLYFELRHHQKAVNPEQWLRAL